MMSKAADWGIVDQNHLLGIRLPKPPARTRYITDEELQLFMDEYATPRIRAHVRLKRLTGLSKQELLLIRVQDLQDDGIHTQRPKTEGKPRIYAWTDELRAAVDGIRQAYRGNVGSQWLYHTRNGQPYLPRIGGSVVDDRGHPFGIPSGFNSMWQRCMKEWKADSHEAFTEHDIRAKTASDTDASHAQELLDHKNQRTTEIYRRRPTVIRLRDD